MKHQPVLLLIFDGWGLRDNPDHNPTIEAHPSHYDRLMKTSPWIPLHASGEPVGLPAGQMGNSEVGHLNLGAGRVVYQDITKITKSIRDSEFFKNDVLMGAINHAKSNNSTLHIMGLMSDGGVHSLITHFMALLQMAKENGIEKLRVHGFLDGRDVPPKSAQTYLNDVEAKLDDLGYPQIATISGRYYAMDRDNRWEREEVAYNNLVSATGNKFLFSRDALQMSYHQDKTDEFVEPCVCDLTYEGMADNDAIIFFNFRPDRARQLTRAFTDANFDGFDRKVFLSNLYFACMTRYDESLNAPVAFPKQSMSHILAQILSENGIRQFHAAETEKYAHVTYFFNGGFETPYPGEDRKLIPSPKVATYDLQPQMNLPALTDEVVQAIESGNYEFIVANFANPDMVGHTGIYPAAMDAVLAVDTALGRVMDAIEQNHWVMLLTADHGNIEEMVDADGNPKTAHTTAEVPFVLFNADKNMGLKADKAAALSNVSPTILDIMSLPIPKEMTAASLLVKQPQTVTTAS